jgi:transcriptional regulator with XRE-family HTH domain
MTLDEWLTLTNTTQQQFADRLGVAQGTVQKWQAGLRYPQHRYLRAIQAATNGKVMPNDFLRDDERGST